MKVIDVLCATIAAIASIVVASIGYRIKRYEDARRAADERAERRAEIRQRSEMLSLRMQDATLKLTLENSVGIISGNNFENIEAALEKANAVQEEYKNFQQEMTAHQVGK